MGGFQSTTETTNYFVPNADNSLLKLIERDADGIFELEVEAIEDISHDTKKFIFKFPNPEWVLGLHVGGHLFIHLDVDGELVSRKYTPVSSVAEKGRVAFVIKIYNKCDEFPNGGKLT
jgi:ferredoxin-NADP reductase